MFWYSFLCLLVTTLVVLEVVIRKADFFSPARLYLFFHSITLGIAFLGLHPAMEPFQPFTSLIYFGSGIAYLLGVSLPRIVTGSPPSGSTPEATRYNWGLHVFFSVALFLFFLSGMWVAYKGGGSFPIFAEKKQRAIVNFNHVSLYSNVAYNMGATASVMFLIAVLKPPRRALFLNVWLWLAVLAVAIFSLSMNRSGLLLAVFFALTLIHYGIRRVSLPRLFVLFVVLLGLFLPISYSRVTDSQKRMLKNLQPMEAASFLLYIPYLYLANNYWNLDYALNPPNHEIRHPQSYGFTTFSGILDLVWLPGGGMLGTEIRDAGGYEDMFHAQSIKVKGLNTITYQWGLYKDFGLAGVLIIPFAFGVMIGAFHRRMRERPNVFSISVYSYFAFFIAFSWFTAMWELINFAYGLCYVVVACYLCKKLARETDAIPVG